MHDATHRSKRIAVQGTERLVALDPYMALWDVHLGVGIGWKRLNDVVCDGDNPLDDHFPTVDGIPGRTSVNADTRTSGIPK